MLFFIPLPRLSVVTFSLRYRVSDFVGGHLTGIMIADLPLEVVQFFARFFATVILLFLHIWIYSAPFCPNFSAKTQMQS